MSIKIYNGVRFSDPANPGSFENINPFAVQRQLRADLIPVAHRLILEDRAEKATRLFDVLSVMSSGADWLPEPSKNFPSMSKFSPWFEVDMPSKGKKGNEPFYHLELTAGDLLQVIFFEAADELLGLPFAADSRILKAFDDLPYVHKYGYWNNSDQPTGVSDEQWASQRKMWDIALLDESLATPATHGLGFQLLNAYDPYGVFEVSDEDSTPDLIPSMEQRIRQLSYHFYRHLPSVPEEVRNMSGKTILDDVFGWIRKRDEALDAVKDETFALLSGHMKADLTLEDLRTKSFDAIPRS